MDIPPNQTLYVKNVTDKVKKETLKRQLYLAFSAYGRVIDVVAMKGEQLRGQAWIVYDDVGAATTALRSLQGFQFFGKPLRISFAKGKSDAAAMRDGTYEPKAKRQKREAKERARAARGAGAGGATENGKGKAAGGGGAAGGAAEEEGAPEQAAAAAAGEVSSVLLAQELPAEADEKVLGVLFGRFAGFQKIRVVEGRGIAFIEFVDEVSARTAFHAYNGFKLSPTDTLKLSYAKR